MTDDDGYRAELAEARDMAADRHDEEVARLRAALAEALDSWEASLDARPPSEIRHRMAALRELTGGQGGRQPPPHRDDSRPIILDVENDVDVMVFAPLAVRTKIAGELRVRAEVGRERYGTYLQAHNGRDALRDAYEAAQDIVMYLRQALAEQYGQAVGNLYSSALELLAGLWRVRDRGGRS